MPLIHPQRIQQWQLQWHTSPAQCVHSKGKTVPTFKNARALNCLEGPCLEAYESEATTNQQPIRGGDHMWRKQKNQTAFVPCSLTSDEAGTSSTITTWTHSRKQVAKQLRQRQEGHLYKLQGTHHFHVITDPVDPPCQRRRLTLHCTCIFKCSVGSEENGAGL